MTVPPPARHLRDLRTALGTLERQIATLERWGSALADVLLGGGRLLACGNGGSAAQAQHLTAELVGRYLDEREALSAICLNAETSSVTAISNDYSYEDVFARQVNAHGRAGDVLLVLSTSGRSPNCVRAATAAGARGITVWALTGRAPNLLTDHADDHLAVDATPPTVQEAHLVCVHLLCGAVDAEVERVRRAAPTVTQRAVEDDVLWPAGARRIGS